MWKLISSFFRRKFIDFNTDNDYILMRRENMEETFIISSGIVLVFTLIVGGIRVFGQQKVSIEPDLSRLGISFILIILFLITRKLKKHSSWSTSLLGVLYINVMICEFEAQKQIQNTESNNLRGAFGLGSLQLFVLFFKMRWFETWIFITVPQLYFNLRFMYMHDDCLTPWLWFGAFQTLIIFYCYKEECFSRTFHQKIKFQKESLEFFHNLLKEYMPNPVLIAQRSNLQDIKLIFTNESCEKMLDTKDHSQMIEKLNEYKFFPLAIKTFFFKNKKDEFNRRGPALSFWDVLRDKCSMKKNMVYVLKEYEATVPVNAKGNARFLLSNMQLPKTRTFLLKSFKSRTRIIMKDDETPQNRINLENTDKILEEPLVSNDSSDSYDSFEEEEINSISAKSKDIESSMKFRRFNKNLRYFSVKSGPIYWDDSEATFLIFNEITDSLLNADLHAKNILRSNKDRLLASVSHRMRTPLNAIICSIDTLKNKPYEKNAFEKQLKLAWRSTQLLYFSIGNLIDLSKINNKNLKLEITSVQVIPLLNEVLELVKFRAKLKELELIIETQGLNNISVMCDPERLKQILLNLLENSIKFTNPGGKVKFTAFLELQNQNKSVPSIHASSSVILEENTLYENDPVVVRFTLDDSGVGISEKHLTNLFDLICSVSNGVSQASEGVKIGLGLSQYLLKKMLPSFLRKEGHIKVRSTIGKGSTFTFLLPALSRNIGSGTRLIVRSPKAMTINDPNQITFEKYEQQLCTLIPTISRKPLEEKLNKIRVLIVDDDQINHLVLKNYLLKIGIINFEVAEDGAKALEQVKKAAKEKRFYDLILMDCNMPVMDGYAATKEIRKLQIKKEILPVKIIAVTANVASNDKSRTSEAGMDFHLTKPLDHKLFKETLERFLEIKFDNK